MMTEEQVFLTALELPTEADRNAYLETACGGDTEFRRQVEQLLAAHFKSGEFLEGPVGQRAEPGRTAANFAETMYVPGDPGDEKPDDDSPSLHFLETSARPDSLGRIG